MISRVELTVGTPRLALIWLSGDMMHYFRHDNFRLNVAYSPFELRL